MPKAFLVKKKTEKIRRVPYNLLPASIPVIGELENLLCLIYYYALVAHRTGKLD